MPYLSLLKTTATSALEALLPSCLSGPTAKQEDSPTSHLDGLRGIAAFFVLLSHAAAPWYLEMRRGYEPGQMRSILQLPIIRLVFDGTPMVVIFCTISGFVLSLKPLRLARNGMSGDCLASISFSIFRRGLRLFVPPLLSTLIVVVLIQLHLYDFPYSFKLPGENAPKPDRLPTFRGQLADWANTTIGQGWLSHYNSPMWTIPLEFHSSMVLFVTIIGLSPLKPVSRVCITMAICIYYMYLDRWDIPSFLSGMMLAELHIFNSESTPLGVSKDQRQQYISETLAISLFILGLFLSSYPERTAESTPGYDWLSTLSENYRHWETAGAVLIVYGADKASFIKKLCNLRPLQYLGKISYALYIVHRPVMFVAVYPLQAKLWGVLVEDNNFFFCWKYYAVLFPGILLILWVADLFWQFVDVPCVTLSYWILSRLRHHEM